MTRTILDLAKPNTTLFNLSNVLNPRVDDDLAKISFHIQYDSKPFNMTGYKMYFISADENMGYINVDGMVDKVEYGDNIGNGDVTFKFPPNVFKKAGTFDSTKTMFVVENINSNYIQSTVNVSLAVLENGTAKFNADVDQIGYDSKLEEIHNKYKSKAQNLIDELTAQVQAVDNFSDVKETAEQAKQTANDSITKANEVNNEVITARSRFSNLNDRLNNQDIKINSAETVTNANKNYLRLDLKNQQQDMVIATKADKNEIANKLSQIKLYPEAFENADAIKKTYPNGKDGIFVAVDTGHQWYWVNGAWKDGGSYQATEPPTEVKDARLWADGQSSKTLGEAIRSQINQLKQLILNDYAGDNQDHDGQDLINEDLKNRINRIETMLESIGISQVDITNLFDEDLVDDLGNTITGGTYTVATDDSLLEETMPANAKATGIAIKNSQRRFDSILDRVNYKYWNTFPILYLDGVPDKLLYYDADKSVKADSVSFRFPFFNNSGRIEKMKVQGASSVKFPKKNYNITFEHPTTLHDAWGARTKYTLKGNFNDSSQARNVVSARIWAGMRKSHLKDNLENVGIGSDILTDNSENEILGIFDKQLALGKGYGTIDGYPVGLVINGKYHGIYNLNIPKDGWMANMNKGSREVIISADYSATNAEYFQALATMSSNNSAGLADFDIEYISGSDDSWVLGSLNQMIGAVLEHHETDDEYVKAIEPYLDIDSAIDYFILNAITGDLDGNGKNYLLETWDGKKWYFASYDKDSTFGNVYWQGNVLDAADKNTFEWYANSHRMFSIIYNHMRDRFIKRWEFLRSGILSDAKLFKMFGEFIGKIPRIAFDEESYLWPQTPFSSVKDFSQIMWWITHHMAQLDKEIQDIK